jgi:glycosyltransferase involved in cell wall biosynthesis
MQICRLTAQKSPLDFIDGAAIIIKRRPDVQFVLIGDGPLFPEVNQRVKELGLEIPGADHLEDGRAKPSTVWNHPISSPSGIPIARASK